MRVSRLCQVAAVSTVLFIGGGSVAGADAVINDSPAELAAARTAAQAIGWYADRKGSSAYEGYCERAARLSWDRVTHHESALEHWTSSDGARHKTGTPPKGAFVFWAISANYHVGIADGTGGVWATDVENKIGHVKQTYFTSYQGWKPGNDN